MFKKVKNFAVRKLIEKQMRNAPPAQRQLIMTLLEKDPKLFETIAKEVKAEMKNGASELSATMKVMGKHQEKLRGLLGKDAPAAPRGAHFNPDGSIHR